MTPFEQAWNLHEAEYEVSDEFPEWEIAASGLAVRIQVKGEQFDLSKRNTIVFHFAEPYDDYSAIQHITDDDRKLNIMRDSNSLKAAEFYDNLVDELEASGFPVILDLIPDDNDMEAFYKHARGKESIDHILELILRIDG